MMKRDTQEAARGLGEPEQARIEERAVELARAAGRETMNEYDLATARREILGPASGGGREADEDEPDAPPRESMPS